MSLFDRETEDKEFALLLKRQQQLEQTPDTTEGILDLQHIVTMMNDDMDDELGNTSEPTPKSSTDSLLEIAGMSITCDRLQQHPSSGDTTSLDETIAEDFGDDEMHCRSNRPNKPITRSAFALFWEGGLLYTVCLILPTLLHWLLYDDSGNLWVNVAYMSTRNAVYDSLWQVGRRMEDVLCSHVDCLEWKAYVLEKLQPAVDYLCETEEVDPFGIFTASRHEPSLQDYVSPFYWAHYLGLCPIPEVEELPPPLPVVSPDITGWEHDVQIILAMSLVLTMLRLVFGLLLSGWQSPHVTETNSKRKEIPTEPLHLQVVVRNQSESVLQTKDDAFADIAASPTEETDRVVNIKRVATLASHEASRIDDQASVSGRSERSKLSVRSNRSTRSIRSALSTTNRRVRGLRQRLFKKSSRSNIASSTDSISTTRSRADSIENATENTASRPIPGKQPSENPLWDELQFVSSQMIQRSEPNTALTEYGEQEQPNVWVGSLQAGGATRAPSSPTASLDSSISTKHDMPSVIRTSQPHDSTGPRNISMAFEGELFDVTELFQLLCCIVAVSQAWFSFRDSNFWPWYVGGHGTTANCWDLSGGLSVGMDSDFDHRNAVLKQYFLGQASYHLFSATLQVQNMVQSRWQRRTSRRELKKHPLVSLIQHLLVLAVFAVAFIFSSLRRLVAVGVFAFDMSKLCWHLCQTISSNRTMSTLARDMYWCLVLPSFMVARFVIWPALWYSAAFESTDWLTQLEQTLWPGSADAFRILCHVWISLLLFVSLVDFRRIVLGADRYHLVISPEKKNL